MSPALPPSPSPSRPPLLAARGLAVSAGGRRLVEGLNLVLQGGEVWCVLGPNGAGKTLLLHTLAGVRPPDAGEIEVAGRRLSSWPLGELACWRGLMPQQIQDVFSASALEVVLQGRHPHLARWGWEGEADHALARAALRRVGLEAFEARDVVSLSGGERQRVALATLLTQAPALALLDEPLAHLDLAQQLRMLDLLTEEASLARRCIVLSVHDLSLAQRVATHVVLLGAQRDAQTPLAGPANEMLTEERLSAAFGHRLRRHEAEGRVWWLPK
jgi:iron complex transport system ATP-binding protein